MGREGPCLNCGIEDTPLWRDGPAEQPVLCNACGSRWRIRGTLDNYIPKHGFTQSIQLNLPLSEKPDMPVKDQNDIEKVLHCPSCRHNNTNNESSSGSGESSLCSCTHQAKARGLPFTVKVPKKKRSVLKQYCLTSTGRLHRQLLEILHQQAQSTNSSIAADDDDLLFLPSNMMMSSTETALGAMLLK